jgi:hypothetical protein
MAKNPLINLISAYQEKTITVELVVILCIKEMWLSVSLSSSSSLSS